MKAPKPTAGKRELDPYTLRYCARQLKASPLARLTTRGSGEETGVQTAERYWGWMFASTAKAIESRSKGKVKR